MKPPVTTVTADLLGTRFHFQAAPGLFSSDRIDDGTTLLLAHLPARPPASLLDVGCGYGALGLPIAARFPEARCLLVDRDMLAVQASATNAKAAGLPGVTCQPSLGYRDVAERGFDWILCNVPARIGTEAIRYLLGEGAARLTSDGELRVVVINDLGPVVEGIGREEQWPIELVSAGARHKVYRLGPTGVRAMDPIVIYGRDIVEVGAMRLERPQDISQNPTHLSDGLPLLLEFLTREKAKRAFVWRGGYGAAAMTLARSGVQVTAADRDLLTTTFTRRNAAALGLELTCSDALWPHQGGRGPFDLVVCESAPQAGIESGQREVAENLQLLAPHGTLLWLAPSRLMKDVLKELRTGAGGVLAQRGEWSVARLRPK
jgi:precorrin-6B methylase 2